MQTGGKSVRIWREINQLINVHERNRQALLLCFDDMDEWIRWQIEPMFNPCPNTYLRRMENAWIYYSYRKNELLLTAQYDRQYHKGSEMDHRLRAAEILKLDREYLRKKQWIIEHYPDVPCEYMVALYPNVDWKQ